MAQSPMDSQTAKQWSVAGFGGFGSLKFSEEPVPDLGDGQVLVKSNKDVIYG